MLKKAEGRRVLTLAPFGHQKVWAIREGINSFCPLPSAFCLS